MRRPTLARPRVGTGALAAGVAGGAGIVAVATLASRVVGFGRTFAFSFAAGRTCLGTAYTTANLLPNVLFEVAAGGALAGVVVPLVVRALESGDRAAAGRVASALLGRALAVLVPLALISALAGPVAVRLLTAHGADPGAGCTRAELADTAARMVLVFVPQIPLYGIAVVTAGVLQAQRRFLAAALAPLVSSLVVVAAYAAFAVGSVAAPLAAVPRRWEAVLTVGTTLGVVALAATTLVPAARSRRVPLRLAYALPSETAAQARRLAVAGLAGVIAQQALTLVVLAVADRRDPAGGIVAYTYAWTLFALPYAVLAVPLATSAFPALSRHAAQGEDAAYAALAARSTRAVVLAAALGAAILAGAGGPLSHVLQGADASAVDVSRGLVAFAPGLVGYALLAHLGRALYARHAARAVGMASVAGWGTAAAVDVALGLAVPRGWLVAAFGVGNTVGMTVAMVLLLRALRRTAGRAGLRGLPRTALVALAAALAGGILAAVVGAALAPEGRADGLLAAVLAGAVGATAYGAVALLIDRRALRELLEELRRG